MKKKALGAIFLVTFVTISAFSPLTKSLGPVTVRIERLTNNTFDDYRPSAFVDSCGKMHVAWAGGPNIWSDLAIYYACKSATGWEIEQLPKPPNSMVNINPSLFIDSHGRPHIAWIGAPYSGVYGWDVWYAVKEGDTWEMDQITHWGSENHQVSLFLDSSDNPHIAWDARYYYGLWGIHYATKIAGTWTIETVHNEDDAAPSLFIDSGGTPHILWRYIHYGLYLTGYGVKTGGEWVVETLPGAPGQRSLYVDPSGVPHVALIKEISLFHEELYYGNKTGGSWSFDQIRDSTASNQNPSIFLDSAGTPYVAWLSNATGNYDVYIATMQEGHWHVVNVSETPNDEYWPSLFVDSSSVVHLAWYSPDAGLGEAEVYYAMVLLTPITATIDLNPDTLNLKSKGTWITAYIQLPEEYNSEDIDATTILLNETIQPVLDPKYDFVTDSNEYLVDHNSDGILERVVKFDRASVESFITGQEICYGNAALTITGKLFDGTPFEGTDIILVFFGGAGGRRK